MSFDAQLHMQRLQALQHRILLALHLLLIQESGLHAERERRLSTAADRSGPDGIEIYLRQDCPVAT